MSIHSLKKNEKSMIEFSDAEIGIFIDNSGSTEGEILKCEKLFARIISNYKTKYVFWNNNAQVEDNIECVYSNGGTDPSSIFVNNKTLDIYKSSNVFILITDGYISQTYVENLNKKIFELEKKPLVIGVIVSRISNPNISVLAPLMSFQTSLIIHISDNRNIFKILFEKNLSSWVDRDIQSDGRIPYRSIKNIIFDKTIYSEINNDCIIL
jgi:hypothetical protein